MERYEEQFDTSNDFPKQTITKHHYIIFFTPRSGSHLIGHYLHQTGQMGFPVEYFNPNNFPVWQQRFGTRGIADTLKMIKRYRTSPNGCFGCKLSHTEFENIAGEYNFQDLFPEVKIIRVRRKDILSQAVSLAKAKMTGSFISAQRSIAKASYSYELIDDALREIIIENARLDYIFAKRKYPYFEVYYEDFLENPHEIIQKITLFVGVEFKRLDVKSSDFQLPKKQRDGTNKEFKTRFIQDNQSLELYKNFDFLQNVKSLSTMNIARQLLLRIHQKVVNLANIFDTGYFNKQSNS